MSNSVGTTTPRNSRGGPSVSTPIDLRRLTGVRRLAADYAYDFEAVAPFFSGDPREAGAWAEALARIQAYPYRRHEIAKIVRAQQLQRGASPLAIAAGDRLADQRSVAVVTGQQAGLFGGPMFVLLKALTAIRLADQVSRDQGVPAVAIFWIDAEDHDWDEVRTCTVFDSQLAQRAVALPPRSSREPIPISAIRLDGAIDRAVEELEAALPTTEFRADLIAGLRKAYAPGLGMAEAFGRWLEGTLGDRGLIVFDSSDEAAKPLARDLFSRELAEPGRTSSLAAAAGAALAARGYHVQVQAADDQLALFHLDAARRTIDAEEGRYSIGGDPHPLDALRREAAERPTAFSPNVLLRPIVQNAVFPTICHVAGPSELAYLGQLRAAHEHFEVPMPLVYPRATATLLDSAAVRFLKKYQLPLEALQPQDEAPLNELLKSQLPPAVDESLDRAAAAIAQEMTSVIGAVPSVDPTLEGAATSTLGRMQHDLHTLRGKVIQAAKRRDETLRRQYMRTRALAFPDGQAQERAIAFVWFLNQYGPALVDRLLEELPVDMGHHWILSL